MAIFSKAYKIVKKHEGGFQSNPKDTGNYFKGVLVGTNKGITPNVLALHLNRDVTKADMLNLSDTVAEQIYKQDYWHGFDELKNQNIANILFDGNVNHGSSRMKNVLKKALLKFDKTIDKSDMYKEEGFKVLNKLPSKKLFEQIKVERINLYKSLNNPTFEKGWIRRINTFYYDGLPLSKTQIAIIGASTSIMLIPIVILGVHLLKKYK